MPGIPVPQFVTQTQLLTFVRNLAQSRRGLTAVLLFSLLVKGWSWVAHYPRVINHDGALYITAAQLMAQGHWPEALAQHPLPLYPALIALFQLLISDWVAAARTVSALALVLTVIPLYRLTQALHSRSAAFWACFALSGVPMINLSAGLVIRGPLFVLCLAWALHFTQQALKDRRKSDYLLASLCSLISILLRLEGLVLLVIGGTALALSAWRNGGASGRLRGLIIWLLPPLICAAGVFTTAGLNIGPAASISRLLSAPRPESAGPASEFLSGYHYIYHQLRELEARSPYPKGDQNFAEIARHFMPLIYLLGVLETALRVLFPVWLVPLWIGLRRGLGRSGRFLAIVAGAFFLVVYATLIHRDFIQFRFLYAPVFCLFPWIGLGLERLCNGLDTTSRSRPRGLPRSAGAFFLAFGLLPLIYLGMLLSGPTDRVVADAGRWLKNQPATRHLTIVTNDLRIPFYAQRGKDFIKFNNIWNDYSKLEEYAQGFDLELIALRLPRDKKHLIPAFKYYREISTFSGFREYAAIYAKPETASRLRSTGQTSIPKPGT